VEAASQVVKLRAVPDQRRLGQRLRKEMGAVLNALKGMSTTDLEVFEKNGSMTVLNHLLDSEDVKLVREFVGDTTNFESAYDSTVLIVLNVKEDPLLEREGIMRAVVNRVQQLRKAAGLSPIDNVTVYYHVAAESESDKIVGEVLTEYMTKIQTETNTKLLPLPSTGEIANVVESSSSKVHEVKFELKLVK